MFEGMRRRWAEARADVASEEVEDILKRYRSMHSLDRRLVVSAFQAMLSGMVNQSGPLAGLQVNLKQEIAKGLMTAARSAFATRGDSIYAETSRVSAYGGALLSLYLELQTLPGDRALSMVSTIEDWEQRAAASE
jgi:hypothetical protein